MLRLLALAALVALPLTLTACDSSSNNNNPANGVRITGGSLIDLALTRPDGSAWDGITAGDPDVYFRFFINDVEIRNTESQAISGIGDETDLPRNFTFSDPIQLNNLSQSFSVEVWDDDGDTDERMAALPATAVQTLATSGQATLNLTDGQTLLRFNLSYVR